MAIERFYRRRMYKQYKYQPTWLPSKHLELGTVGYMQNNRFIRVTHLRALGIDFVPEVDPSASDEELVSSSDIHIIFKPKGKVIEGSSLLKADIGIIVEFDVLRGFTFVANGFRENWINVTEEMKSSLIQLYEDEVWKLNYCVITDLCVAESATVIVALGRGAKIELKAQGQIDFEKLNLANLEAKLKINYWRDISFKTVSSEGMTPLFNVQGIVNRGNIRDQLRRLRKEKRISEDADASNIDPLEVLPPKQAMEIMGSDIDFGKIAYNADLDKEEGEEKIA